ncbi:DUF4013 domain-containing protein [Halobellus rufus]|uniref:DUF4013 domain-containing protein n=1 Tax=Halobellus rufus TaxID=1448860 RepID=UPI0006785364|nr:DUF4013 domain-containing protein [Halobellus rufus]
MIQESLQYLRTDEDRWVRTVLIGGILSLLSVLVVPTFLVLGYLVRVVRGTMHDDDRPPVFDEWGDLFVDGLKAFVVAFVYGLVPAVIATVVVGGGILSFAVGGGSESGSLMGLGMVGIILGSLLALVLSLLAAYVIPAAIAAFAETDRIGAAFSFGELRPVLGSGTYATAWLSGVAILLGAGLIAGVLNAVPVIGQIATAFLGFYATVSAYYLIGHAWGELRDVEMTERDDAMGESPAV